MKKTFELKVEDARRNELEAAYYETETAARNATIALSRSDSNDKFNAAFNFQWERLVKFAKVYEDLKEKMSDEVVRPELKKRNLKDDVSWNLDFDSAVCTVTYDDAAEDASEKYENQVVINCPAEYVKPVEGISTVLNAYDTIMGYIARTQGAGLDSSTLNDLGNKQSETYKDFVKARNDVENNVVQAYLAEKQIEANVTWELKYSTAEITISY